MEAEENWSYQPVPRSAERLFRLCWQLESWLRTIVYVELKAWRADWEEPLRRVARDWPPKSLENDKTLHHMATPHQAAISYLTFSQLWNVISDENAWPNFESYFPPKGNAFARIEEVKAIRNRVAHFREPHPHDLDRLSLFIRDMEPGIRRFCSRYTQEKRFRDPQLDQVATRLEGEWGSRGYGVELDRCNGGYLYAPHPHRGEPLLHGHLDFLSHQSYLQGSLDGVIYAVRVNCYRSSIDFEQFFLRTQGIHEHLVHILLAADQRHLGVTIPAVHGVERTTDLVFHVLSAAVGSLGGAPMPQREVVNWPEYVLWPDHLLTFYSEGQSEPILDVR